ncbi:hypothetical protein KIW84_071683 [Lathyrus oleraceus]|uniref:No apical meristem-associated C-terminal domain-containing protein n=1 Tax=Pisum sativum TaxID=3888 RepID=A0A9D4VIX5_PEA|nr:hypothetical protein KIW84_071683 [Pisum sativum]
MQNYQNPNPQNSQIPPVPTNPAIFLPSPNNPNMYPISQMNSNSMEFSTQVPPFSTQVPPFSTHVGTEKEERVVVKKRSREQFTREEDILLIQSWLNVSKDPIVGVDQKAESFWLRIAASYNQYRKKSGTSETDVMADAHAIFAQDQGTTFNLEYAWRLLKDEAKWRIVEESIGSSAKITKTYASGASSENPDTTSSYEFNSSSPMERPMGQKAAKRKGKASEIPNATQDAKNKRAITMDRLAQAKEDELELRVVQMMMKDTSTMNDSQRDIHEKYCNKMKKKYGIRIYGRHDEEQQLQNERRSGSSSRPKRRTTVDRGREEGHNRLFNDYFSENPVYTDVQFRRRFRMHRHVFLRIVDALGNHDEYFQMRVDATGKMGLSPLQKCTSAIRMLAYGSLADLIDEYVRIGESTSIECLERFVKGVNVVFGAEPPTDNHDCLYRGGFDDAAKQDSSHHEGTRTTMNGNRNECITEKKTIPNAHEVPGCWRGKLEVVLRVLDPTVEGDGFG